MEWNMGWLVMGYGGTGVHLGISIPGGTLIEMDITSLACYDTTPIYEHQEELCD